MRRAVRFHLDPVLIEEFLGFPEDDQIVGVRWDFEHLELFVEGPNLPEVSGEAREVKPIITRVSDGAGGLVNKLDWNLGDK